MISLDLPKFFESARNQGATDEALVVLLRGRGWPEDEARSALADDYEARSGLTIPGYKRSSSAKDAFLYLVSFITLATWSYGLGAVLFTLIDQWIKDPLRSHNDYSIYLIADSLASMIIAFPVYLLAMRYIVREVGLHPEKLESAVRRWLTSIALLIVAAIAVGDLIYVLTSVLRGELTSNFAAKAAVVLAITGGIFWYYFGTLQQKQRSLKSANE